MHARASSIRERKRRVVAAVNERREKDLFYFSRARERDVYLREPRVSLDSIYFFFSLGFFWKIARVLFRNRWGNSHIARDGGTMRFIAGNWRGKVILFKFNGALIYRFRTFLESHCSRV